MDLQLTQNYTYLSDKIVEALNFSARAHRNQLRKDSFGTPYFAHPAGVGLILARAGCEEDVIIAGILHDVIEDTEFSYEDIASAFGTHVADLVRWVSIPKGLTGKEGKLAYLDNLEQAPVEARMVSGADMLYNRIDLVISLKQGEEVRKKFNFETYLSSELNNRRIQIIEAGIGSDHALVKDLKQQQAFLQNYFTNGQHTSGH